jgi:hypothetical protein
VAPVHKTAEHQRAQKLKYQKIKIKTQGQFLYKLVEGN